VCSNAGIGRRRRALKKTLDTDVERLFVVNLFAGSGLRRNRSLPGRHLERRALARGRPLG